MSNVTYDVSGTVNEEAYLVALSCKTDVYEERNHNGRIANALFLSTSQTKAILKLLHLVDLCLILLQPGL